MRTYNFSDYIWLFVLGWLFVYLAHAAIGGLISIFYRWFSKDDTIKIWFK
jgi:hypothetical protein